MSEVMQYLFFGDWLILRSLTFSRFTHAVPRVSLSFLFKGEYYLEVCVDSMFLPTHWSVDTWVLPPFWPF